MKLSKNYIREILFLLVFLLYFFYYNFHLRINLPPQSNDIWRQSDCASFALNQYTKGINPFQPMVHNCLGHDGHAAGEFPLLYSFVALLYKIFGVHYYLFRGTVLLIFFFGLRSLYRISRAITGNEWIAFCTPFLLFATPLISFYANNFLCDVPSLSFTFMAWDYFISYRNDNKKGAFVKSMIFFMLAGLLKANSMFSLLALGILFALETAGLAHFGKEGRLFRHTGLHAAGFLLATGAILAWYQYAIAYNQYHTTAFLGTSSWPGWPLWEASTKDLLESVQVFLFNLHNLFNPFMAFIFYGGLVFILLNLKHLNPFYTGIFLLLLTAQLMFSAYFFVGFRNNFYYLIGLMVLPVFVWFFTWEIACKKYPAIRYAVWLPLFTVLLTIKMTTYGKTVIERDFYNGGFRFSSLPDAFFDKSISEQLIKAGINKNDKVICLPDFTPNGSLQAIDRQGWTTYNFYLGETPRQSIFRLMELGAAHLVIYDTAWLHKPGFEELTRFPTGKFRELHFFKLPLAVQYVIANQDGYYWGKNQKDNSLSGVKNEQHAERFIMTPAGEGKFSFKNLSAARYICSEGNENGRISISRESVGTWEQFEAVFTDSLHFALRAYNGKLLGFDSDRGIYTASFDSVDGKTIFTRKQVTQNP